MTLRAVARVSRSEPEQAPNCYFVLDGDAIVADGGTLEAVLDKVPAGTPVVSLEEPERSPGRPDMLDLPVGQEYIDAYMGQQACR